MGIVVIGAVFVDIKGYPTNTYIPAGRNEGRVEEVHGGVSRNVCEDIANVELKPTFLSVVDESGLSDDVIRRLQQHKVNTDYIRRRKDGLGTWLAVFDHTGDVVASISKRPDLSAIGDIIDDYGDEIFCDADSVIFEIDIDREIMKKIFFYAEKYQLPVFALVSNMTIALERRSSLKKTDCFVCNVQEAGMLFSESYEGKTQEEMQVILSDRIRQAQIPRMVVTLGSEGAVYADLEGNTGFCPARRVSVVDTTGAGDAFFAGVALGLTYQKTLAEASEIGTRLAAATICTTENVCPRFLPEEFGLRK